MVNSVAALPLASSCGHLARNPFSGVSIPYILTANSGLSGAGKNGALITTVSPSFTLEILA